MGLEVVMRGLGWARCDRLTRHPRRFYRQVQEMPETTVRNVAVWKTRSQAKSWPVVGIPDHTRADGAIAAFMAGCVRREDALRAFSRHEEFGGTLAARSAARPSSA